MGDAPIRGRSKRLKALAALPLSAGLLAFGASSLAVEAASAAAPPGRAYEIVSPLDDPAGASAGISSDRLPMPGVSSRDGDTVIYGSPSPLGSSWSGPANAVIFGYRTATGWEARTANRTIDHGNTPLELLGSEPHSGVLTPDGSEFIFGSGRAVPPLNEFDYSLPGVFRSPNADEAPDWLSRPGSGLAIDDGVRISSTTTSYDAEVVAFSSDSPLTSDAPSAGTRAVYASRDGQLELISRLPDGSLPPQGADLANHPGTANSYYPPAVSQRNQVSGNGRFVLFRVGTRDDAALYVRDLEQGVTWQLAGGAPGAADNATHLRNGWGRAGQSVGTDVMTVPDGALVFGAREGKFAYFKTATGIANDAFLYQANLETGDVTARPEITGPPLGVSPDGRRILFFEPPAAGTLVGDWTLRYWTADNPGTSIAVGTVANASGNPAYGLARVYRSSQDGSTWIFTATNSPDPDRPNVNPITQQLYRWTVGDNSPTCLSCETVDGVARSSGVNVTVQESIANEGVDNPTATISPGHSFLGVQKYKLGQQGHSLSDDGRWMLFDSPDRLVAEDINNVRDVYLWDRDAAPGGKLFLVTGGRGSTPSYAIDLDPTGKNAFFSTRDSLVPDDKNGYFDVYTARIGGGFPPTPVPCAGESCRSTTGGGDPSAPPIGSGIATGDGNVSEQGPAARVAVRARQIRPRAGAVARLRVRVPAAGVVRVVGARTRSVRVRAAGARTVTLRIGLKPRFKRALHKRNRLRAGVRVVYRSSDGRSVSRRVGITFKGSRAKSASTVRGR